MSVDKEIEGIQNQINNLIGTSTKIVRRKKNNEDIKHELFISIITQIELVINRSTLVRSDFKIDLTDYSIWETDNNNFEFGNFPTDLNGDGLVDLSDYSIWESNSNAFIFSFYPQ